MGRKAKFSEDEVRVAQELVAGARTAREVKVGLSVTLAAVQGMATPQVAATLDVGLATVTRLRAEARCRAAGEDIGPGGRGGRRRETLSVEEETEFLADWTAKAGEGGVLVVGPLHAALEERVGHQVAKSTVYRMLARHGWRKLAPDSAHPKRDVEAQEAFKKGASRKLWRRR